MSTHSPNLITPASPFLPFSQDEVKKAKVATNEDFPEGGFDGLLQAIVCEDDIKWRDVSVRVIVFSTDAGFHMAGDGKVWERSKVELFELVWRGEQLLFYTSLALN